mgnify:FL=1
MTTGVWMVGYSMMFNAMFAGMSGVGYSAAAAESGDWGGHDAGDMADVGGDMDGGGDMGAGDVGGGDEGGFFDGLFGGDGGDGGMFDFDFDF